MILASTHPLLVISFQNCELHCCHLDGFGESIDAVQNRIAEIESRLKGVHRYRIWYNVDQTVLSHKVIELIRQSIVNCENNIFKLAFVGAGRKKKALYKAITETLPAAVFPIACFRDAELAKKWLV